MSSENGTVGQSDNRTSCKPAAAGKGAEAQMPVRVVLSRAKGWRMPANTVKVDRTTKWVNPFSVQYRREAMGMSLERAHESAVFYFRSCASTSDEPNDPDSADRMEFIKRNLRKLRGVNLACWCKPGLSCHADVLLELANSPEINGCTMPLLKCRHCGTYPVCYTDGYGVDYFECPKHPENYGESESVIEDAAMSWNAAQVELWKTKLPEVGNG